MPFKTTSGNLMTVFLGIDLPKALTPNHSKPVINKIFQGVHAIPVNTLQYQHIQYPKTPKTSPAR